MTVLGVNAYHGDVSAAVVRAGELVAAEARERCSGCGRMRALAVLCWSSIAPSATPRSRAFSMTARVRNGQRLVLDRFTWERVAGQMLGVYGDVLRGTRTSST